jgi:hypothetical protein
MLKTILIAIISLTITTGAFAQKNESVKSQVRKIGSFDKIKATKGINVTLTEGSKEEVRVEIENGSLNDVVTQLKNKQLTVKMKTKIYNDVAIQVYVTYVDLREIDAGTGASIDADNTIIADKLILEAGTDAKIKLDVDVNAIEASVSAGRIELSGKVESQLVKANNWGKYLAYELESQEAIAKANTGAKVEVTVNKSLKATVSNGADIKYKGKPEMIEKKISMGGKVEETE